MNSLHHVKDRSWDEDVHTLRRPGLGEIFATLVNTGLNVLRLEGWFPARMSCPCEPRLAPSAQRRPSSASTVELTDFAIVLADSVLAGTAVRTHRPKRGATVFHCHALHVPRRSLGPALQAVDFGSVRRCGHGQLLHRLASIQLWPTPLQRSRTLFCSIVALKAQVARQGGDTPGQSRFNCAGLSAGSPLTSVSRLSRSSAVTTRTSPVCTAFSRPFRPGLWNTVPVMMS